MKAHVICHMLASLDGGLHSSRFTTSPDSIPEAIGQRFCPRAQEVLDGDAWIIGGATMG